MFTVRRCGIFLSFAAAAVLWTGSSAAGTGPGDGDRAQADPAQTAGAVPDLAGTWDSTVDTVYHIQQSGSAFTWTVENSNEQGKGEIAGAKVTASWEGGSAPGSAEGGIVDQNAANRALKIEWTNGVVFTRRTDEAVAKPGFPAAPPAVSTDPSQPLVVDVSGTWTSSVGLVYQLQQSGEDFTWTVDGTPERGAGRIRGKNVLARWINGEVRDAAEGEIVSVDDGNRATRIQWKNGVLFQR